MESLPVIVGILATIIGTIAAIVQIVDYLEKKRGREDGEDLNLRFPRVNESSVTHGLVENPPSAPFLQAFVGYDVDEIPLNHVLEKLGEPKINDYGFAVGLEHTGRWVFYNYYSLGISISLDGTRIRAIHCYSGRDGTEFDRYVGELPFGISWADTRKVIEDKLGPPDTAKVLLRGIDAKYEKLSLTITYDRVYINDLTAKMQHIVFQ